MANAPVLEAQYGAIIDGIAMLKDMQPAYSSPRIPRLSSASRAAQGRPASPSEPTQRARPMRTSSREGSSVGIGPTGVPDYAANRGLSRHGSALQPSSEAQNKVVRPSSREETSSAWGVSQLGSSAQHERRQGTASRRMSESVTNHAELSGRAASGHRARIRPMSRQGTPPQVAKTNITSLQAPSLVCSAQSFRPTSAQARSTPTGVVRPSSRQQQYEASNSSAVQGDHGGSHAMGMTLSQYMSQMPSREAAAGESWARPVSASLTAEDCRPPDRAHMIEDLSSIEDDESPGWRDEDHWHTAPVRQSPSPPGPEDTETATSRHLRSARGNGLDLRPATAAGVTESQGMNSPYQDASATRQTDLGSLSAQLFAPRPQSQGGSFRPPSRRLSRPSTAQRAATRQSSGSSETACHPSASMQQGAAGQQAPGLVVRGGRKVQSARPSERDQRPPSRQKPPPEALHLFQPMHGSSSGGFAPSPVFRVAAAGTARPSTSASIMQQASAPRFKPSPVLHSGRMTLEDLQKLSDAAVSNSQAIASSGMPADRATVRPYARPPSARPTSARPPSAR